MGDAYTDAKDRGPDLRLEKLKRLKSSTLIKYLDEGVTVHLNYLCSYNSTFLEEYLLGILLKRDKYYQSLLKQRRKTQSVFKKILNRTDELLQERSDYLNPKIKKS